MQTQERIVKLFGAFPRQKNFSPLPASASVAWRMGWGGRLCLCISVNGTLMKKMDWLPKDRVNVRLDYLSNQIVLVRNTDGRSVLRGNHTRGVVEMKLSEARITGVKPAKPMQHTIKDGVLLVNMPLWLSVRTRPVFVPAPVAAVPAPVVAKPKPTSQPYIGIMNRTVDPAAVARGKR